MNNEELQKEIERIELRIKEFQSKLLFDGEWEGCCRILEGYKAEIKGRTEMLKEILGAIDTNLKDIEFTFETMKKSDFEDEEDKQEHIIQLIGRREALTELKESLLRPKENMEK